MRLVALIAVAATIGCERPSPTPETAAGAFARLAPCIDRADARCLYEELDRDSRWSVQTLHKTLTEMRLLVDRSYPPHRRDSAYGRWAAEARAADAPSLFAAFCERTRCLEGIARGFGAAVEQQETAAKQIVITTTRGGRYPMASAEGRWGLSRFREELQAAKIAQLDRVAQVRRNAREFDEQAVATGRKRPTPDNKEEKHDAGPDQGGIRDAAVDR